MRTFFFLGGGGAWHKNLKHNDSETLVKLREREKVTTHKIQWDSFCLKSYAKSNRNVSICFKWQLLQSLYLIMGILSIFWPCARKKIVLMFYFFLIWEYNCLLDHDQEKKIDNFALLPPVTSSRFHSCNLLNENSYRIRMGVICFSICFH